MKLQKVSLCSLLFIWSSRRLFSSLLFSSLLSTFSSLTHTRNELSNCRNWTLSQQLRSDVSSSLFFSLFSLSFSLLSLSLSLSFPILGVCVCVCVRACVSVCVCERAQKMKWRRPREKKNVQHDSQGKVRESSRFSLWWSGWRWLEWKKKQTFANFQKTTDRCRRSSPLSLAPFKSENHTDGEF